MISKDDNKTFYRCGESGVTLVELLVVIIIIAIVAGIALMQRGSSDAQLRRQNVATQLKTAFERARFDSVKRRAECVGNQATVTVNGSSFTLSTFEGTSGSMTATPVTTSAPSSIVIADGSGTTLTSDTVVYFNQRGEAVDSTGAPIAPTFLVCSGGSCPNPLTTARVNRIYVSPTGTVNMLGAAAPPTLGNPGGTGTATDSINNNLVLTTATGCS